MTKGLWSDCLNCQGIGGAHRKWKPRILTFTVPLDGCPMFAPA